MATEAIEQVSTDDTASEDTETPAGGRGGSRRVVLIAAAGLLAGGATGMFGTGPLVVKRRLASAAHAAAGATDPAADKSAPVVVHAVDNLVLNPAGSDGTRFLMVSATFQLRDAGADQIMRDHEAEVRDRMLEVLGKKTVEELTDPSRRETIKKELIAAVAPLFPAGSVRRVFFPQFVIQ
jgi:flagellar FliL protein